ncbi:hypothetical protein AVEN_24610-1 [Araneus ventricosus]|uniref:Uncharacterized protein n=1 Tax=Araneus ventricosus TaxID=182803 RepID=A0A4Y2IJF9_ARAVE|nr:hypothetical protein AVEN_24610-1 [Araneus ventricosus]
MVSFTAVHLRRRGFIACPNSTRRTVPTAHTQSTTALRSPSVDSLPLMSEHLPTFLRNVQAIPQTLEQQRFFVSPRREIRSISSKEPRNTDHGNGDLRLIYRRGIAKNRCCGEV